MLQIIGLTLLFCLTTVISILLMGSRAIIGGEMTPVRIFQILLTWQFILGAVFAFASRLVFMVLNSFLYKTPGLSESSTTVTTLITTVSLIFVIIANYVFLDERIKITQMIGAVIIFIGIYLVTK